MTWNHHRFVVLGSYECLVLMWYEVNVKSDLKTTSMTDSLQERLAPSLAAVESTDCTVVSCKQYEGAEVGWAAGSV